MNTFEHPGHDFTPRFATCADAKNYEKAKRILKRYAQNKLKDRPPAIIITADGAMAGKTHLAKRLIESCGGRLFTTDASMMRPSIDCAVAHGFTHLLIDGVCDGDLLGERHTELCSFITSQNWRVRKYGNKRAFTKLNRVAVIITGDNLQISRDLQRRSIIIELRAPVANGTGVLAKAETPARDLEPDLEEICTLAAVYQQQKDKGLRAPNLRRALIAACEGLQPDIPF